MHAPNGSPHNKYMHIHRERINYQITLKVLYKTGSATCVCKDKAGLYTEISPRGGEFGVWTKEGGGRRVEAQWYHVRCYTLGGARMTQGGANAPPCPSLNTAL